jgi:hypothetical protein
MNPDCTESGVFLYGRFSHPGSVLEEGRGARHGGVPLAGSPASFKKEQEVLGEGWLLKKAV